MKPTNFVWNESFNHQIVENNSKNMVEKMLIILKILSLAIISKAKDFFDDHIVPLFEFLKENRHFVHKILEISAK